MTPGILDAGGARPRLPDRSPALPSSIRRIGPAVVLGLAVLLPFGDAPSAAAADPAVTLPAGVTRVPASVTFHGRGYGHGVGLSQYGARGRALAGQTAATILAHYYRGTTAGTISPSTPIRVLLLSGWKSSASAPLTMYGRGGTWTIDGIAKTFPADARLSLAPVVGTAGVSWRLRVVASGGTELHDAVRTSSFRVRPAESGTSLALTPKPSTRNRYRGVIRILPAADAAKLSAVNELGLDLYLRGVVPAEMPSSWPTEALRAQAIVARSYAARALRPGVSTWDVHDDTRSQVYHGLDGERSAATRAVKDTAGMVLRSGSALANTVFHSTAGGHTEHNENAFVSASGAKVAGAVSYLRGVPDLAPDGTSWDAAAPFATWSSGTWTATQLSSWLAADARTNVGAVVGLDLRNRGVSGRLISVTLYGSTGTKRVSADVFRSVVNARKPSADRPIRSNLFEMPSPVRRGTEVTLPLVTP
jgi:SpoIID/LytB domain protein